MIDIKKEIEQITGIPAMLLNGETLEENIAQARALMAYKREQGTAGQPTREQFAGWLQDSMGLDPAAGQTEALADLERRARNEAGFYPNTPNASADAAMSSVEVRTPKEQFAEWLHEKSSYDPRKGPDGWKKMI